MSETPVSPVYGTTEAPAAQKPQAKTVDAMKVFAHAARTQDGFDNFISRLGINEDNALSAGTYEFNLISRNRLVLEAAYRGSWVVGVVVDAVPQDMTRAGIDITTKDKADLKKFKAAESRLKIWQSLASLIRWGRLYGGAIGVMQIEGQKLDTELNIESVAKDQFKGIVVYDRWQLQPDMTSVIKSGPEMGLPEFYAIVNNPAADSGGSGQKANGVTISIGANIHSGAQIKVHHSRIIRSVGIELPYFQAITEQMWGESILERLWDRLIAFDNVTMSSASLVDRANLRTVGIDGLREIIAAGGEAQAGLVAMFDMMRQMQVNEGVTLLDKNDDFSSTAYTFSGLSDMMLQFGQQLAGASGIPLVRFFGQSPAGMSATGESDMRMYYDNINALQESDLRNPLEVLLKVMWQSVYGQAMPEDLEFSFTPLWQMSATDKANNAKTTTETIAGAFEAGITTRATTLKELRDASAETGVFTNITDEQIKEAEEEPPPMPEEDPPVPGAEAPASGGLPALSLGGDAKQKSAMEKIKAWLSGN